MQRRHFLQTLAAAPLLAAAPVPNIRLGFDTYSLRAFGWKSFELIDYAVAQGLDTIQFSSLDDFASLEPAHLKQVAERAARAGITIDGGTGCICPVSKSWTAKLGTPELQITQGLEAGIMSAPLPCAAIWATVTIGRRRNSWSVAWILQFKCSAKCARARKT